MRFILSILLLASAIGFAAAPDPAAVAILYNKAIPESVKLAETYRAARQIPEENLVGLDLVKADEISRADYDATIQKPLRDLFVKRGWWVLGKNPENLTLPVQGKIRFLAIMRGVPLRITQAASTAKPDPKNPFAGRNEASVDSELLGFGIQGLPLDGFVNNVYYKSKKPIQQENMPFLLMISRIDGATWETCDRMIRDAIEAEKTGLWGRAYVDIANKFPEGDQWLEAVAKQNLETGIPTVVDRFDDTLPTNYPMTDASLYYGWYDWNISGPFLNPKFKFRPGAVAMHLHSFSAEQIRNPNANWSAGLLERGAACTVGNVYEPYLQVTHSFEIIHQRLLDGSTWAEAVTAAIPGISWQGVAFGDPLYRPFAHFDGSGERKPGDNDYRALRLASIQWGKQPRELLKQLQDAAQRTKSGILSEAVGLRLRADSRNPDAVLWFNTARQDYVPTEDKLRQEFNILSIDRSLGRKDVTTQGLREARARYSALPESAALVGWLSILDPPPPPPANPANAPKK